MAAQESFQFGRKASNTVIVIGSGGNDTRVDWFTALTILSIAHRLSLQLFDGSSIAVVSPPISITEARYTERQKRSILLKLLEWLLIGWTYGVCPKELHLEDIRVGVPPGVAIAHVPSNVRVCIVPKAGYGMKDYNVLRDIWNDILNPIIAAFELEGLADRAKRSPDVHTQMVDLVIELNREMIYAGDRIDTNYFTIYTNPLLEQEVNPRGLTISQLNDYIDNNLQVNPIRALFVISMMHYHGEPIALDAQNINVMELEAIYDSMVGKSTSITLKPAEVVIEAYSRRPWYLMTEEQAYMLLLFYKYKFGSRESSQSVLNLLVNKLHIDS